MHRRCCDIILGAMPKTKAALKDAKRCMVPETAPRALKDFLLAWETNKLRAALMEQVEAETARDTAAGRKCVLELLQLLLLLALLSETGKRAGEWCPGKRGFESMFNGSNAAKQWHWTWTQLSALAGCPVGASVWIMPPCVKAWTTVTNKAERDVLMRKSPYLNIGAQDSACMIARALMELDPLAAGEDPESRPVIRNSKGDAMSSAEADKMLRVLQTSIPSIDQDRHAGQRALGRQFRVEDGGGIAGAAQKHHGVEHARDAGALQR
jgi:hypothetical protein